MEISVISAVLIGIGSLIAAADGAVNAAEVMIDTDLVEEKEAN